MELKCVYCGKRFGDALTTVILAADRAHQRHCAPAKTPRFVLRAEGKAASRGRYAGTPELLERVRMEGCLAYIDGERQSDNPYEGQIVNRAWLEGWMVAEMAHKEGMHG